MMTHTISRDVLDWAQDLAAIRKLLAGEPPVCPFEPSAAAIRSTFGTRRGFSVAL
jgi:hypothetical protein